MMDDKKLRELVLFETDKIKDMSDDEMIADAKIELGRVFPFFQLMATTTGQDDSMAVLYIVAYLAKFIFADSDYSYSEQRFLEEVCSRRAEIYTLNKDSILEVPRIEISSLLNK